LREPLGASGPEKGYFIGVDANMRKWSIIKKGNLGWGEEAEEKNDME
jgi:hypothetical protein